MEVEQSGLKLALIWNAKLVVLLVKPVPQLVALPAHILSGCLYKYLCTFPLPVAGAEHSSYCTFLPVVSILSISLI